MLLKVSRGWGVECTHCNGDPIPIMRIPEQERTACSAEPSPHLCGRLIPTHILPTRDHKARASNVCRGKIVPGLPAALGAVTSIRSAQVTGNSEAHATTEA